LSGSTPQRGPSEREVDYYEFIKKKKNPKPNPLCRASKGSSVVRHHQSVRPRAQPSRAHARRREEGRRFAPRWMLYLIFVARPLAVLGQTFQRLVDQRDIFLVDVQTKQSQPASCAPTDAVQELQGLAHQVVVGLVVLAAKEILRGECRSREGRGRKQQTNRRWDRHVLLSSSTCSCTAGRIALISPEPGQAI